MWAGAETLPSTELIDNRIERDRKVCEANLLIPCPVRGPGESLDLNNFVIPNNAVMR